MMIMKRQITFTAMCVISNQIKSKTERVDVVLNVTSKESFCVLVDIAFKCWRPPLLPLLNILSLKIEVVLKFLLKIKKFSPSKNNLPPVIIYLSSNVFLVPRYKVDSCFKGVVQ